MKVDIRNTVDEYIESFLKYRQELLKRIRNAIYESTPNSEEGKSYKMPTHKKMEFCFPSHYMTNILDDIRSHLALKILSVNFRVINLPKVRFNFLFSHLRM